RLVVCSFSSSSDYPDSHPFPTRRSSDLFRMRAPQRLNTVFVQAGVKLALIYSKSRREPDQGCPKDSPEKSREQERADTSEESLGDRKSTRLNSSHVKISYAVFCLKKKSQ